MRSRYIDIDDRTHDLADLLREKPAAALEFQKKFQISWIYHDCALEGVVFTGDELVKALSDRHLTEAGSLDALRDIRNFEAAIEVVRSEAAARRPRISLALVKRLHETLHAGMGAKAATEFRTDIPLHRAYYHEIAPPGRIAAQLGSVLEACGSGAFRRLHPVQQASNLQHAFMQVYPYTEGSGKVARLLSNLLLIHAGYQPCIVHTIDRQRYYESLKLAEPQLRELMLESIENALVSGERYMRAAAVGLRRAAR